MATCEICEKPVRDVQLRGGSIARCPSTYIDQGEGLPKKRIHSDCERAAMARDQVKNLLGRTESAEIRGWLGRELGKLGIETPRAARSGTDQARDLVAALEQLVNSEDASFLESLATTLNRVRMRMARKAASLLGRALS